jgi:hypothetical protein
MKKIIFILLFPILLFAQNEKQQALELPDFIITGTRGIDVPILQKRKPKLIPVLTDDFFMPLFSPEEFVPAVLSNPYEKELQLVAPNQNYEGKVILGVGRYTMPTGEFSFTKDFSGFIINLNAAGTNITDYLPNSGYNNTLLSVGGDYFIKGGSDFFNGTKFSFDARYFRNSYKMYATATPWDERNTNLFNGSASISNNAYKYFGYNFSFAAQQFKFNLWDAKEDKLEGIGNIEYKTSAFNVAVKMDYTNQRIKTSILPDDSYSMLATDALLKVKPADGIQAGFGAYLANYNSHNFFMPKANIQLVLNDNLSLFADFSPAIEFYAFSDIVSVNRYSDYTPAVFQKKKADMKVSVRYEYGKYFDITGGIGFASYDDFLYFEDNITTGIFTPYTTSAKRFYSYVNLNFHPGPMGYFYGNVTFQNMQNDNDMYIPYQPALDASLVYGYDFDMGILFRTKLDFQTSIYTGIANNEKLSSFVNLGFSVGYKILNNLIVKLDLNNATDSRNYFFRGYREKPFDIVAGVEYRW